jgi:hypothetical protein
VFKQDDKMTSALDLDLYPATITVSEANASALLRAIIELEHKSGRELTAEMLDAIIKVSQDLYYPSWTIEYFARKRASLQGV